MDQLYSVPVYIPVDKGAVSEWIHALVEEFLSLPLAKAAVNALCYL